MTNEKPDLAAVLDYYGATYKPDRSSQKILCPVHEEHVQSCSINLDEGWFNCHACGAKGDSWNLIMLKEGIGYAAAVKLAEGIARASGGNIRKAVEPTTEGLFGRSRPVSRDRERKPFRPGLRAVERS